MVEKFMPGSPYFGSLVLAAVVSDFKIPPRPSNVCHCSVGW